MTPRVLAGVGTFTEVAWFDGQWWVVWQDGTVLRITTFSEELLVQGPVRAIPIGEQAGAFPRMTVSGGQLWLAYRRGAPDYAVVLDSLTGDDNPRGLRTGYGNEPVAFGLDDIAWQSSPGYQVSRQAINDTGSAFVVRYGAPTGLSRITPDGVRLVDEDRLAIPGYTRPCWAGDAVAVEGAGLYDLVIRNDGKQVRCFDGEDSQTPRLAWDGGERYLIGTWGKDGVRIALLENSDFVKPVPDPPPPEDDMHAPGVTIDHWDSALSATGDWKLAFHDRNEDAPTVMEVTFHNGYLRVKMTNAEGVDISGATNRHVTIVP